MLSGITIFAFFRAYLIKKEAPEPETMKWRPYEGKITLIDVKRKKQAEKPLKCIKPSFKCKKYTGVGAHCLQSV